MGLIVINIDIYDKNKLLLYLLNEFLFQLREQKIYDELERINGMNHLRTFFLRKKLIKIIDIKIEKEIAFFFHFIKRCNEAINEKNKYKIFKLIFVQFSYSAKRVTRIEKIKEEKYMNMLINRLKKTNSSRETLIFFIITIFYILILVSVLFITYSF